MPTAYARELGEHQDVSLTLYCAVSPSYKLLGQAIPFVGASERALPLFWIGRNERVYVGFQAEIQYSYFGYEPYQEPNLDYRTFYDHNDHQQKFGINWKGIKNQILRERYLSEAKDKVLKKGKTRMPKRTERFWLVKWELEIDKGRQFEINDIRLGYPDCPGLMFAANLYFQFYGPQDVQAIPWVGLQMTLTPDDGEPRYAGNQREIGTNNNPVGTREGAASNSKMLRTDLLTMRLFDIWTGNE